LAFIVNVGNCTKLFWDLRKKRSKFSGSAT